MAVKYQVFVSSTYEDLKAEREVVVKAVLEMGHIPVGMEMFSAADQQQWQIIQRHIESSDYYVVIVAHRYGSLDDDGRSFTEKEYDYAVERRIPVLGFVIADSAAWPADRSDKAPKAKKALDRFKAKVKTRYISYWSSEKDLYGRVSVALTKQITAQPGTGWIRGDQAAGPEVLAELTRLTRENAALRSRVDAAGRSSEAARDTLRQFIANVYDFRRARATMDNLRSRFNVEAGERTHWERALADGQAAADKAGVMLHMELPGTEYAPLLGRAISLLTDAMENKLHDGAIMAFAQAVSAISREKPPTASR